MRGMLLDVRDVRVRELSEPGTRARDVLDSTEAGGRIIRGGAMRVIGYALSVGLSVLSAALLTRYLGVARFGYYTTVISLVAVVATITDTGVGTVGTREFAVLEGAERAALMGDVLALRVVLAVAGVLLVSGFALAAGYSSALLGGAVLASLGTIALVMYHTYTIPLTADLRLGTLSALELVRQALSVAAIVTLIVLGAGVLPLLAVALAVNLVLIAPSAALARHTIALRPSARPRQWLTLLRLTLYFSLASAVGTLYIYTAQILTSLVSSEHQSGLFAASFRIFVVLASLPSLLLGGALPLLARAARDDRERLSYALGRIFEVSLIMGVAAALTTLAGAQFMIDVVAGAKYAGSVSVLQVQGLALPATFVLAGWSFALLSLERYREVLLANLAAFAVSFTLTTLLAGSHGASGAAIATVCGESVLACGLLIGLVRGHPELRPARTIALKVLLASAPAAVVALQTGVPSPVRALLALCAYGLMIVLTGAAPDEIIELLPTRRRRAGVSGAR